MTRHTKEDYWAAIGQVYEYLEFFGPFWCLQQFRKCEGTFEQVPEVTIQNARKRLEAHKQWRRNNGDDDETEA